MSSILKALRRLEEEDGSRSRPLPEEFIAVPGAPLRRDGPRRVAGGIAIALVALGLIGGFAWWMTEPAASKDVIAAREPLAPPPVAAAPQAGFEPAPARRAERAPSPVAPAPRAMHAESPPARLPEAGLAAAPDPIPQVAALPTPSPEPAASERRVASPRVRIPAAQPPTPVARRAAPALTPRSEPRLAAPPARQPAPTPVARAPRQAPAPVSAAKPRRRPAPLVIPPPPAVAVEKTFWHPSPERRTAQVRLPGTSQALTVREGESVATLEVTSIEPSAVVFRHEGRALRRRVGERP